MSPEQALARKELRALAPLAAASAGVILAAGLAGFRELEGIALVVYFAGSAAMGATLIGHELQGPLLGPLLAQPITRALVLRVKYLAGALAIAALGAIALWAGLLDHLTSREQSSPRVLVLLVMATALFVAPWLTMLTRSALAGVVGALVSPVVLMGLLALLRFDQGSMFRSVAVGMAILSAVAAVRGWRLFTRGFEDAPTAAGQIHFRLPRLRDARARTGSPRRFGTLTELAAKEIRLHQLPIALAGLYVAAGIIVWLTDTAPANVDPRLPPVTELYGGMTALLIGAMASAEERHMGTMPWQVILPVPVRRQFLVKTVVALALSAALTSGIPALLALTTKDPIRSIEVLPFVPAMLGLTLIALYVSSLFASSLRAFVISPFVIAVGAGLGGLAVLVGVPAGLILYDTAYPLFEGWTAQAGRQSWRAIENRVGVPMMVVFAFGLAAMLWRFALANHGRAENAARPAGRQALAIGLYVVVAAFSTFAVVSALANGPTGRSVLAGTVLDERGDPVRGVQVQVLEASYLAGRRVLVPRGFSTVTDLGGRFLVSGLSAGTYRAVAVTGGYVRGRGRTPVPSGQFAPTFYPATTDPASAATIALNGRDRTEDLVFTLRSVPTARAEGRVVDERGQPVSSARVSLRALDPDQGTSAYLWPLSVRTEEDGRFAFDHIPPGDYVARAIGPTVAGQIRSGLYGSARVTLAGENVTDLEVELGRGAILRGRFVFEGDSPRPAPRRLGVMTHGVALSAGEFRVGATQADWTFEVRQLDGPHLIRVPSLDVMPTAWALKEVRLDGHDVINIPIDFGIGRDVAGVEIVLTDRAGRLSGSVNDASSRDAAVVVFPSDPSRWTYASPFLHLVWTDETGRFETPALLPGDYRVVALRREPAGVWDDPEVLEQLRPLATPVTVSVGATLDLTLDVVR